MFIIQCDSDGPEPRYGLACSDAQVSRGERNKHPVLHGIDEVRPRECKTPSSDADQGQRGLRRYFGTSEELNIRNI